MAYTKKDMGRSMMLQDGNDVETVTELRDWKDPNMVFWYAKPSNSDQKKATLIRVPSLDNLWSNGIKMADIKKTLN